MTFVAFWGAGLLSLCSTISQANLEMMRFEQHNNLQIFAPLDHTEPTETRLCHTVFLDIYTGLVACASISSAQRQGNCMFKASLNNITRHSSQMNK